MKIIAAIIAVLALVNLASCTTTQKVTVSTSQVEVEIRKQPAPRDLDLSDPKWIVITENNYEAQKAKILSQKGKFIVYALVPDDYKGLVRNQIELKRYISQQKSIIVYYEKVSNAR